MKLPVGRCQNVNLPIKKKKKVLLVPKIEPTDLVRRIESDMNGVILQDRWLQISSPDPWTITAFLFLVAFYIISVVTVDHIISCVSSYFSFESDHSGVNSHTPSRTPNNLAHHYPSTSVSNTRDPDTRNIWQTMNYLILAVCSIARKKSTYRWTTTATPIKICIAKTVKCFASHQFNTALSVKNATFGVKGWMGGHCRLEKIRNCPLEGNENWTGTKEWLPNGTYDRMYYVSCPAVHYLHLSRTK